MQMPNRNFDDAVAGIYRDASAIGVRLPRLIQLLHEYGGVETVRRLIFADSEYTSGFVKLFEAGRSDLTLEAVIVDNREFHTLFTDEEMREFRRHLFSIQYRNVEDPGD
ncbi:MAG: hypothetical protein WCI02_13130 [Planctomycetota bacterium]